MTKTHRRTCTWLFLLSSFIAIAASGQGSSSQVGREVAIPVHLQDGEEFTIPKLQLIQFGAQLFNAKFTVQEGAGSWNPRNFDRISSPDANSCSGCHNTPVPGA